MQLNYVDQLKHFKQKTEESQLPSVFVNMQSFAEAFLLSF